MEEFKAYQVMQNIQEIFCKQMDEDWLEIRKGNGNVWYLYCIEDSVMQGCENRASLKFKYHIIDELTSTPEDKITIPCYDRLVFNNITEDIDLAEFYRQYKLNILHYNKYYSSRFKLSLLTEENFAKKLPILTKFKTAKNNILLLLQLWV